MGLVAATDILDPGGIGSGDVTSKNKKVNTMAMAVMVITRESKDLARLVMTATIECKWEER